MLVIRPAREADTATLVDFNQQLAMETERRVLATEVITRGIERALARPEYCRYYVAERADEIVGQTMITYEWTDWRDGLFWWIQSVYVRGDQRGQGVFRQLYEHIASEARATPDVRGIRLYVETENTAAQETYRKLGMRPGGYHVYEVDWSM